MHMDHGLSPLSDWALDPSITHLSHGSYGGLRARVQDAQIRLQREVEEHPDSFFCFEAKERLVAARAAVARAYGAEPGALALVGGAMAGLFTVLRSFPFSAGDEVVYSNHGYRLVENGLRHLAARRGIVPRRVDVPLPIAGPGEIVDAFRAGIGPRTRLLVVDHVTSPTALEFPVAGLVALAKEHGLAVLVDGAHAPGHVDLDLASLDADFYVGNLHKWVCAPRGTAFLHAKPRWHDALEPPVYAYDGSFEDRFLVGGTGPLSPQLAIPEALDSHAELEALGYRAHAHALVTAFRDEHAALFRCETLGGRYGNMVSLPLPAKVGAAREEEMRYRRLFYEKHRIEVPFTSIPGDERLFVRPSAHAYTRASDFGKLLRALREEFGGANHSARLAR